MDLMCEWVKYFNINLYVPTYAYFARSCAENICILFTCLPTPLFARLMVLRVFFSPHLVPSTLHGPNSRVTRSALFIIVYLERTCFIRQAVLPCPIDSKASVGLNSGVRGREKEKERKREKPFYTFSSTMKCIKPLGWTCIDMKNMDFRQSETPEHIPKWSPKLVRYISR